MQNNIYISRPQIKLAQNKVSNEEILRKVESNFKGEKVEFRKIKSGISFVFRYCDTNNRFLGCDEGLNPLDYAINASKSVCRENSIDISELDLVVYGGIYRQYFEPATAMEIASALGVEKAHVFDVTNACAGLLQSILTTYSIMVADPSIKNALCCTTDFPDEAINYDIQSFEELSYKAAGLTLGSGAAAFILTREKLEKGCARLLKLKNTSIPKAFNLCKVPINEKKFSSESKEIFDFGLKYVPDEIRGVIKELNWDIDDIDHFISHQPSKKIIHQICDILKIDKKKATITHQFYGNTVNSSVPMTLDYILKEGRIINGHKLILSSAAAGFTMLTIAAEWVE